MANLEQLIEELRELKSCKIERHEHKRNIEAKEKELVDGYWSLYIKSIPAVCKQFKAFTEDFKDYAMGLKFVDAVSMNSPEKIISKFRTVVVNMNRYDIETTFYTDQLSLKFMKNGKVIFCSYYWEKNKKGYKYDFTISFATMCDTNKLPELLLLTENADEIHTISKDFAANIDKYFELLREAYTSKFEEMSSVIDAETDKIKGKEFVEIDVEKDFLDLL